MSRRLMQWSTTVALPMALIAMHSLSQEIPPAANSGLQVQKLDMKAGMHPPKAIYQPEAEYSPEARKKQIDGKCLISMIVDAHGMPQNVHVVRCSDPVFAQPSLTSTSKYRFNPALAAGGNAVAVVIEIEVDFRIDGLPEVADPIRLGFGSPPGTNSPGPDAAGTYPLMKGMSPPIITKYNDKGYGQMSFSREGKSPCEIVLTIDAKGKPSDAVVSKCEPEGLAVVAIKSLTASKYKPGQVNGKAVPTRTLIHLEYGDFPMQP